MLARTLQHLIRNELTTVKEISELTGVASSTVYRWINGSTEPDFNAIRLLLRHLPNRRGQEALIAAFVAGTPWQFQHPELDLDVNNDGTIDAFDALDASIESVRCAGEALKQVRTACRDNALSAEQTLQLVHLLNQVTRQCAVTQQVLVHLCEARQRRKLKLAK